MFWRHLSRSGISQLLLIRFSPNFKVREVSMVHISPRIAVPDKDRFYLAKKYLQTFSCPPCLSRFQKYPINSMCCAVLATTTTTTTSFYSCLCSLTFQGSLIAMVPDGRGKINLCHILSEWTYYHFSPEVMINV